MLVALGGFIGSGRMRLARLIAHRHKFHLFDVDSKADHYLQKSKDGSVRERSVPINTDQMQVLVYDRVLSELPIMSKMHTNMIVIDSFHRVGPREFFLREAQRFFDDVVFVWIDADERHIERQLRRMKELSLIDDVAVVLAKRKRMTEEFDPLGHEVRVFKCVYGDGPEAHALWALVQGICKQRKRAHG